MTLREALRAHHNDRGRVRYPSVIEQIDSYAAAGKSVQEIAALVGRDRQYVEFRVGLWRLEHTGGRAEPRLDHERDARFVKAVWAEAKRLGLVSA